MTDLERLIRDKQDRLRGRPEDWIDRFGDWRRRIDWLPIVAVVFGVAIPLLAVALMLVRG